MNKHLVLMIIILIFLNIYIISELATIQAEIDKLEREQRELEQDIADYQQLLNEVDKLLKRNQELYEKYDEVIDILEISTKEVTMYAPTDPGAVEGM